MELIAIVLVLLSVLSMGAHSTARKWLFNNKAVTETEMLVSQSAIAATFAFLWFLSVNDWEMLAAGKSDATIYLIAIAGTTLANIAIQFANTRATRLADLSLTSPIAAMTPGFVVLSAAFFGEYPSTVGYVGIGLIVVGAYIHAREGSTLKEYLMPLFVWTLFVRLDGLSEGEQANRRALRWAYSAALCATIGLTFDGLLARHGNMVMGVTIELMGLTMFFLLMHRIAPSRIERPWSERFRKYWPQILCTGMFFGLPFILLGVAFRLAPIAYVGSLKRLSIPITLLLAWWILGEMKQSKRRLVTGSIIAIGAILLTLDPTQAVLVDNLEGYLKRFTH